MAIFEIPLDPSVPAFSFFVDLDGETYRFYFRWNSRTEIWMFDAYDLEGNAIQQANPLYTEFPLLRQNQSSSKWPGTLVALSEKGVEATRFNIGTDVKLYYREAD